METSLIFGRTFTRASKAIWPSSRTSDRSVECVVPPLKVQVPCPLTPLITQTSEGDIAAFRSLYDTTSPQLYGIVSQLVADRAAAEEVLIDTYLVIWATAARFAATKLTAIAWLSATARRCAVIRLRNDLSANSSG